MENAFEKTKCPFCYGDGCCFCEYTGIVYRNHKGQIVDNPINSIILKK